MLLPLYAWNTFNIFEEVCLCPCAICTEEDPQEMKEVHTVVKRDVSLVSPKEEFDMAREGTVSERIRNTRKHVLTPVVWTHVPEENL